MTQLRELFLLLSKALMYTTLVLLIIFSSSFSVAQKKTTTPKIIVGGDHHFPPYEFLDENGEPAGFNVALTQAIAKVMGIEVEFVFGEWSEMRIGLQNSNIDILQGMVRSEERAKEFEFAPPHAIVNWSLFAREGMPKIDIGNLQGHSVIVQRDGIMHDYLLENNVDADIIPIATHAGALRLLSSGQHDYALVANLPSLYLNREIGLSNISLITKAFPRDLGYAVKKGNSELLAQFSEGLAILKNTGRYDEIYSEWLGTLETGGIDWKQLGLIGAVVSFTLLLILGGIVIVNRTLQRKVESRTQELQQQQQQLIQADKMSSLGILVSGVAHEINNPTGLLLLNLSVLTEAYDDTHNILESYYQEHGDFSYGGLNYSRMRDEIPKMLNDMRNGAKRIKRIVDDLKDFARHGEPDLNEEVNINDVVATSIRLVDASIRKTTNNFNVSYCENVPKILGNSQRIEQVIINLILNACQALDNINQSISVKIYRQEDKLYLDIKDMGCGIAVESLTSITDPFFTTKREDGGTGLGLSVSAGIVEEHNGSLEFQSEVNKGTTVTLTLPIFEENNIKVMT